MNVRKLVCGSADIFVSYPYLNLSLCRSLEFCPEACVCDNYTISHPGFIFLKEEADWWSSLYF